MFGGVSLCLDKDGYYKSRIDEDKCTHCGKCLNVCPCRLNAEVVSETSYVGYCKSDADTLKSTSGGAGYAIAKGYLEKGYAIIGAAWSNDFIGVRHIVAENDTDLDRLRKSKYVQSYTPDAFRRIAELKKVVVFGTPCQIAGLRKLYGEKDGLVLVDFDCMGPAGQHLWHKALDYYRNLDDSGIHNIWMRDKKKSWMLYGIKVDYKSKGGYWADKFHDPFCILYHFGRTIQDACVKNCKFLNSSMADVRIGDAWNDMGGFTTRQIRNGLSIVTPLTGKGIEVLNEMFKTMEFRAVSRKQQKLAVHEPDERVRCCLNDPNKSIWDAVSIYNDVDIGRLVGRKLSYMLSANEMIYLLIKKMQRKLR